MLFRLLVVSYLSVVVTAVCPDVSCGQDATPPSQPVSDSTEGPAESLGVVEIATSQATEKENAKPDTDKPTPSFAGRWSSTYGDLDLLIEGSSVSGVYGLGTIEGTVEGHKLVFRYQEENASGDGEFQLSEDGRSFQGKWRVDGSEIWRNWRGKRGEADFQFTGLWKTARGPVRLFVQGDQVTGVFPIKNEVVVLDGKLSDGKIEFTFDGAGETGEGWFCLQESDGQLLSAWKPESTDQWVVSTGQRVSAPPGKTWLVILEANWERGLAEPQYAFGHMLKQYFTMATARHVQVRHRFFHDQADLTRFCREVCFLPGPVVLLISTHGTPKGITVFGDVIDSGELSEALVGAGNVRLVHLSGCSMMRGNYAEELQQKTRGADFAVSGYSKVVSWDASAIGDFTYLTMVLLRHMEPAEAVGQAIKSSPYMGASSPSPQAFAPLGLSVRPAAGARP